MAKSDAAQIIGCIGGLWVLFISVPCWLVLLFGVLSAIGDSVPVWLWVLYWCYVPANIISGVLISIARMAAE